MTGESIHQRFSSGILTAIRKREVVRIRRFSINTSAEDQMDFRNRITIPDALRGLSRRREDSLRKVKDHSTFRWFQLSQGRVYQGLHHHGGREDKHIVMMRTPGMLLSSGCLFVTVKACNPFISSLSRILYNRLFDLTITQISEAGTEAAMTFLISRIIPVHGSVNRA